MRAADDKNFDDALGGERRTVVADFWAPWCRPCDRVTALLEGLERRRTDVLFVKVNADESVRVAARCGVLALPTVIVFRDGEEVARIVGSRPRRDYESAIR